MQMQCDEFLHARSLRKRATALAHDAHEDELMKLKTFSVLASVILILSYGGAAAQSDPPDSFEPEAYAVVEAAYEFLADQTALSFTGAATYDVEYQDGIRAQYGMEQSVDLQRGAGFRAFVDQDDFSSTAAWYDGDIITIVDHDLQLYGEAEAPGSLNDALIFASDQLNVPVPLVEILRADSLSRLISNFEYGLIIGQHEVAGYLCDHVLFGNEAVSVQLWIDVGDHPLLRKIVVTYQQEPGVPQYAAVLADWDIAPDFSADDFSFSPPAGFEPIGIVQIGMTDEEGE